MSTTQDIIRMLEENSPMTNKEIAMQEVADFKGSMKRKLMILGQMYYENKTKILEKKRTVVGEGGVRQEVHNLANNKLIHGFVRKLVDQKTGYLLSKPFSIQTDGPDEYKKHLSEYFGKDFQRTLKNVGKNAINKGIAWLQVYYTETEELAFKSIPSEEIVPLWKDSAHTELDAVIRFYDVIYYEAKTKKTITIVEFWDSKGVMRFSQDRLVSKDLSPLGEVESHFTAIVNGKEMLLNWERPPFVAFKYNDEEQPLIEMIKTLVDDYDLQMSENADNIEDMPSSIIVLKNYGGGKLEDARRNLAQLRMVRVEADGGIDTLGIDIDTTALSNHIAELRKSIYEFGRGVDTQTDKFGNNPSGIALRSLYQDLDLDANTIEAEFQASLEQLLWFVDQHLYNTTKVDYSSYDVDFILNRDVMINETEAIENVKNSVGILSDETNLANHPWVTDVKTEEERKKTEADEAMKTAEDQPYGGTGGNPPETDPKQDEQS
ncbi:phage portal protein [Paenibacillus sp. AK121]|uniref:phage portal protein n=1 Tax=Paenibacillus TaxID=44249 RepID=UPI001C22B549|nr:phage portal protein [Paenibacillus sp. AK121]MBU9707148.1 phage portal protein [Paenibacillus sp. AK121]MEE4566348.1 phage portal protein [Paenibacillus polymyxa]